MPWKICHWRVDSVFNGFIIQECRQEVTKVFSSCRNGEKDAAWQCFKSPYRSVLLAKSI